RSLVTMLAVPEVPLSWETLYPAPDPSSTHLIQDGHHDGGPVHQYVRITLQTGSVQALTDAPTSTDAGWFAGGSPSWSSNGQEILLPGTFLSSKEHAPSRPCVAVVDLPSNTRTCVETLKVRTETSEEEGYHLVLSARFAGGDKSVIVRFFNHVDEAVGATEYRRVVDGSWQVAGHSKGGPEVAYSSLKVAVKQGLNEPPMLVATNKHGSRIIWDPNPQLKNIDLARASVYAWKDKEGRDWKG